MRIAPSSARLLAGKVIEHTHLGNASEYVVAAGAVRLRVQTHPSQVLAVGEAVAIEFDPQHCTVFSRAES